jgi:hypothetical protein
VEATIAVLGYGAVFLNIAFCIFLLIKLLLRSSIMIPKWIVWINLVLLPLQLIYFFFSNFLK